MKKSLWNNKEYFIQDMSTLNDQILEKYINVFWKDVVSQVTDKQHILFIPKVRFINNQIVTLSPMQKININSKEGLITFIKDRLTLSNESYKVEPVSSLIFSYGIRDGVVTPTVYSNNKVTNNYQIYYNNQLPIALLPEEYGIILSNIDNNYTISVNRGKSKAIIILTVTAAGEEGNKTINNIKYFKSNNLLFTLTDTIISNKDRKFIRRIGKSILHYEDGELVLYTTIKKTTGMKNKIIPNNNQLNNKFLTMDLETVTINNVL